MLWMVDVVLKVCVTKSENRDAWIEMRCESRCRMQKMSCRDIDAGKVKCTRGSDGLMPLQPATG